MVIALFALGSIVEAVIALTVTLVIYTALWFVSRSTRRRWLPLTVAGVALLAIPVTLYLVEYPKSPSARPSLLDAAGPSRTPASPGTVPTSPSPSASVGSTPSVGASNPVKLPTRNVPSARSSGTPAPTRTAKTVEVTFSLPNARYIDVDPGIDTGQIIVQETQTPGDSMDYQIEPGNPGSVAPRGHALLAPQSGQGCGNGQVENNQLRKFNESPFCGTSGEVAPSTPKHFELKIVAFQAGNCTIRVTYY